MSTVSASPPIAVMQQALAMVGVRMQDMLVTVERE